MCTWGRSRLSVLFVNHVLAIKIPFLLEYVSHYVVGTRCGGKIDVLRSELVRWDEWMSGCVRVRALP